MLHSSYRLTAVAMVSPLGTQSVCCPCVSSPLGTVQSIGSSSGQPICLGANKLLIDSEDYSYVIAEVLASGHEMWISSNHSVGNTKLTDRYIE